MPVHKKIHHLTHPAKSGFQLLFKKFLAANPIFPFSLFLLVIGVVAGLALTMNSTELRQQAAYAGCNAPATQIVGGVDDGGCRCPNGEVIEPGANCANPTTIVVRPSNTTAPTQSSDNGCSGSGGVCRMSCLTGETAGNLCSGSSSGPRCCYSNGGNTPTVPISPTTKPATRYSCQNSTCVVAADGDFLSVSECSESCTITRNKANGQSCTTSGECLSNYCNPSAPRTCTTPPTQRCPASCRNGCYDTDANDDGNRDCKPYCDNQCAGGCSVETTTGGVCKQVIIPTATPKIDQACYYGVTSCSSINRYGANNCTSCPTQAGSCCGDIIQQNSRICTPGAQVCSDFVLSRCNSSGTAWDSMVCGSGTYCQNNSCVPLPTNVVLPNECKANTCVNGRWCGWNNVFTNDTCTQSCGSTGAGNCNTDQFRCVSGELKKDYTCPPNASTFTTNTVVVTPAISNLVCTTSGESRCVDGFYWKCSSPFSKFQKTTESCTAPSFTMNSLPGEEVANGARGECDGSKSNTCSLGALCIAGKWIVDSSCNDTRPYVIPITQNTIPQGTRTCPINARECTCSAVNVGADGSRRPSQVIAPGDFCFSDSQVVEVERQQNATDIIGLPTLAQNTNYQFNSSITTDPTINYQGYDYFNEIPKGFVEGLCNAPFLGPCTWSDIISYTNSSASDEDIFNGTLARFLGISPSVVDSSNRLFYCEGLTDEECAAYQQSTPTGFVNRLGDAANVGGLAAEYMGLINPVPTTFSSTYDWWTGTGTFENLPAGFYPQPQLYNGRLSNPTIATAPFVDTNPLFLTLEDIGIRPVVPYSGMNKLSNEDSALVNLITQLNELSTAKDAVSLNESVYNYFRVARDQYPKIEGVDVMDAARKDLRGPYVADILRELEEKFSSLPRAQRTPANKELMPLLGDYFTSPIPAHMCTENSDLLCGLLAQQGIEANRLNFTLPALGEGHGVVTFIDPTTGVKMIADPTQNLVLPFDEYFANRAVTWGEAINIIDAGPVFAPIGE